MSLFAYTPFLSPALSSSGSVQPWASAAAGAWLAGFGVCLSLLVSIGAQNLYVLRQAVQGQHVGACVLWCVGSDAALIGLGVGGMSEVLSHAPALAHALALGGAAFLVGYGLMAWHRAWRASDAMLVPRAGQHSRRAAAVLGGLIAITLLNPHVYLDTVLLIGSIGARQPGALRWLFVAGAASASLLWFLALTGAARRLRGVLARPQVWRALDLFTGALMLALALWILRGQV